MIRRDDPEVRGRAAYLLEAGICLDMTSALMLASNESNWTTDDGRPDGVI